MMRNSAFLFFSALWLFACNQSVVQNGISSKQFQEPYRPQYHFTPPTQWMNDPNGMVYYDGEYHLFYQHYPNDNVWGPMHWGHAVSKDMISWKHLPIAIYPDSLGYIFSGSAVLDWKNSSGFGNGKKPPLVAIYTYHNPKWLEQGRLDFQYQGIAYSNDNGRSWTKYEKNPVIPNQGMIDFRDPKVMWNESSKRWIMTLAVWDHVSFYSSKDLKTWVHESDFGVNAGSHAGVWECPDLFPMKVQGTDDQKWVLLVSINPGGPQGGSATQYFVGSFDGHQFVLDEQFKSRVESVPTKIARGLVFEGFEGNYNGWKSHGKAFAKSPAKGTYNGQNKVSGFEGSYLANSYNRGDSLTGTLESAPFNIVKPYINFLLGGGNEGAGVFASLSVNGVDVYKTSGRNGPKLEPKSWDVSDYIGQTATIRLVDEGKDVWSHLLVDHFVFSDEPNVPTQEQAVWIDYGADNYAGVTWSDIPEKDGRRILLGWMSNWQYAQNVPTTNWRSAMTLPRELTLTSDLLLKSTPVRELQAYIIPVEATKNGELYDLPTDLLKVDFKDLSNGAVISLLNEKGEEVSIIINAQEVVIDRSRSGLVDFNSDFPKKHVVKHQLSVLRSASLYMDKSSLELFINDGELVLTDLIFPTAPMKQLKVIGAEPAFYSVRSIWD